MALFKQSLLEASSNERSQVLVSFYFLIQLHSLSCTLQEESKNCLLTAKILQKCFLRIGHVFWNLILSLDESQKGHLFAY